MGDVGRIWCQEHGKIAEIVCPAGDWSPATLFDEIGNLWVRPEARLYWYASLQ